MPLVAASLYFVLELGFQVRPDNGKRMAWARPLPNRPYIKAVIGGVIALETSSTTSLTSKRCVATLSPAQGGPSGSQLINISSTGSLSCPEGYQQLKGVQ